MGVSRPVQHPLNDARCRQPLVTCGASARSAVRCTARRVDARTTVDRVVGRFVPLQRPNFLCMFPMAVARGNARCGPLDSHSRAYFSCSAVCAY